jgi:hypothetical protein
MKRTTILLGAAMVLACLPAIATAQWFEDFDSYAAGTKMDNVNGWFGWDNVGAVAGTITDAISLSAPNSIACSQQYGEDTVHPFTPLTTGAWTFIAHQYIPDNLDGMTYFILNNVYNHGGPWEWAIEMHMDPATGLVNEQIHDEDGTMAAPIVYDAWTEIRVDFDLDADSFSAYYNGAMIATGQWTTATYPTLAFANVDLYAPHATAVYYDDLALVPEPAGLLLLGLATLLLRRR